MPTKKQTATTTATAEAPTAEAKPKPTRKPRAKKATAAPTVEPVAAPEPPAVPTCPCGKVLDWRDRMYVRNGACKRCTERASRAKARGTYISADTYCAVLASRQKVKSRRYRVTALRDLPARERALALRKRGKVA